MKATKATPKKKRVIHESAAKRSAVAKKAAATRKKNHAHTKKAAAAHGAHVKKAVHAVKAAVKSKPGLAAAPAGSGWISCNHLLPCCSALAAANSLLAVTGWRVSDDAVYALHFAAGGTEDEGAALAAVMETLAGRGLAGIRPALLQIQGELGDGWAFAEGTVSAVLVPGWQPHVVTVADSAAASWGGLLDPEVLGYAYEAWRLTW